jgi:hypothetical protein
MVINYSQETPYILFSSRINRDEFHAEEKEKVWREREQKIKGTPLFFSKIKKKREKLLLHSKKHYHHLKNNFTQCLSSFFFNLANNLPSYTSTIFLFFFPFHDNIAVSNNKLLHASVSITTTIQHHYNKPR